MTNKSTNKSRFKSSTFFARVTGCTYLKKFEINKSLYNITAKKWLVIALC